jgi:hypothetical protein
VPVEPQPAPWRNPFAVAPRANSAFLAELAAEESDVALVGHDGAERSATVFHSARSNGLPPIAPIDSRPAIRAVSTGRDSARSQSLTHDVGTAENLAFDVALISRKLAELQRLNPTTCISAIQQIGRTLERAKDQAALMEAYPIRENDYPDITRRFHETLSRCRSRRAMRAALFDFQKNKICEFFRTHGGIFPTRAMLQHTLELIRKAKSDVELDGFLTNPVGAVLDQTATSEFRAFRGGNRVHYELLGKISLAGGSSGSLSSLGSQQSLASQRSFTRSASDLRLLGVREMVEQCNAYYDAGGRTAAIPFATGDDDFDDLHARGPRADEVTRLRPPNIPADDA